MPLFAPDCLIRCRRLSLLARQGGGLWPRLVREPARAAGWITHRDYAAGDDWRQVDWHICARHDELRTRRVAIETYRRLYVLVDCSRSMRLHGGAKFDAARRAAAALAHAALAESVAVTVCGVSDRIIAQCGPLCGKGRSLAILRFLESLAPEGRATNLARAADLLIAQRGGRGPVAVISDLLDPAGFRPGLDALRTAGWRPEAIHVYHPAEADPQLLGDVEIRDVESGETWDVTVTERDAAAYRRRFEGLRAGVAAYCRRYGLRYVSLCSDLPEAEVLRRAIFEGRGGFRHPGGRNRAEALYSPA